MAEETEDQEGTQTETGNTGDEGTTDADSSTEGTSSKETKEPETNWEQRYKDLQVESTRSSQEAAELRSRVEQLERPAEDFSGDELADEGSFVDRKTVKKIVDAEVQKAVGQVRTQAANAYFRRNYKDLVKYENAIAGIMRSPKNPEKLKGVTGEERIDAAVKEFNALTEEAKTAATVEAEAKAKAAEEAKRKASGLGSTTTSTPSKGDEDISDADELKRRKARQAKQRGFA